MFTILPDPMLTSIRLHPMEGEAYTFRVEAKDGYASHSEPVVFELAVGGWATRVRISQNYLVAVEGW